MRGQLVYSPDAACSACMVADYVAVLKSAVFCVGYPQPAHHASCIYNVSSSGQKQLAAKYLPLADRL